MVGLAHIRYFKELLLTAPMPIRLRLDFIGNGTTIDDRGSVCVATASRLIFYLLHIEAVFIADLFVQRGGRGAIT